MNKRLVAFVQSLPGWLTINEGSFLENVVKQTHTLPGEVVEIGSFCGKSTIWLAQRAKKVYAIDPHKGHVGKKFNFTPTYKAFKANLEKAHVSKKVKPLVTTSYAAAKKWKKDIKVLFIDGLHDKKHAELDYISWSPHVIEGGIIAIHDSFKKWCGSETVAVKKIVFGSEYYKIGFVDSIIYGVKGKGTLMDRVKKFFWQIVIVVGIGTNRSLCILEMIRDALKNQLKLFSFSWYS